FAQIEGGAEKYGFDYSFVLPQGIQNKPYAFYENGKWLKLKGSSQLAHIPFEQTQYEESNRNRNRDGVGDSNWDPSLAGRILANKAVQYIKNQAKKSTPFYLYYCSQAVHVPHTPTKKLNRTKIAGTTLGRHGDMIKELDAQVGLMVKALKRKGIYKNTLFVFTSDNGGLNRDKKLRDAGHDSSNGLTGQKGSIYEGGHRVPFIAVWPGRIEAGTESSVTIVGQDMVATLAVIAEVETSSDKILDSANLLPVLTQKSTAPLHKYLLHQSQARGGPYYALREGDWKLIFKAPGREKFDDMERIGLYNLKENRSESQENNLLDRLELKDQIEGMHRRFLSIRKGGATTLF
ncbi:MAG: sulfatase-like hydrolase/transferase, partial [Saprospiraceae bacterium]|nr:sulfatase-like hydrolase/transferase [Saprospiraceae bacterium]